MKEFDWLGLKLCQIQADIFASSLERTDCSSPIFIRRFMNSEVARRIDTGGFLFEACDINNVFEQIEEEYGVTDYGKDKYTEDELYWIGYIYRYWSYTYEKSSRQIYQMIKPKELRGLYYPYHSLDPSQAIERILEAKGLDENEDKMIKRGVSLMKDILQRKKIS